MNNRKILAMLVANAVITGVAYGDGPRRPAQIEEVIVTARKNDEMMQQVPVAVTAVSSAEMLANNVSTIADLSKITPSLDQREGRKQGAFAIRGVGQQQINDVQADPGVGVYMDGIFLARNDSQLIDTLALESVQVLRGPQGTLFGKNSVGGAILVTTMEPKETFAANINAKVDNRGERDIKVSFDVPLVEDKWLSKITLGSIKSDGYADDVDTGRHMGDDDRLLAALQTVWMINDDLSLKTLAYFNKQDENMSAHNCQQVTLDGNLSYARAPGRSESYHEACSQSEALIGTGKVLVENEGGEFTSRDALLGATLTWDTSLGTLKSITSYSLKGENHSDFDFDATDLIYIRNTVHLKDMLERQGLLDDEGSRYTIGQEFQFAGLAFDDKLSYTVGVFASKESLDNQLEGQSTTREGWVGFERLPVLPAANAICAGAGIFGQDCLYVRGSVSAAINSYDNTSYAAFSQATYDLTPAFQLTAGLRYTYEQREIRTKQFVSQVNPSTPGLPIPFPLTIMTGAMFNALEGQDVRLSRGQVGYGDVDFERLSPMASLSWNVSDSFAFETIDSLLAYATVSEGFKSGGFNVLRAGIVPYEPEYVISTELGIKLDAFDRHLRLNTALYNSDYKDVQIVATNIPSVGVSEISTNNAGRARMRGAEFELTWLVNDSLMLLASGNYIDAEFLEFDDQLVDPLTGRGRPIDRSSEPFPFIPKYVYNLSARYTLQTESFGDFQFVLSRYTRSEQFMGGDAMAGLPQYRDAATIDGFSTWSSRITWTPGDGDFVVSLYGNNITDKEYVSTGGAVYSGFGTNSITMGKERSVGMEVSYEFN